MDAIINTFHLDWKIMIAQLVNSAIVVFVLWRFVFKPLGKKMEERTKTIETSLAQAQQISDNLKNSESERQAAIIAAKKQAQQIIEQAQKQAVQQGQEMIVQAQTEVKKIVEDGKAALNLEKISMVQQAKAQVAELVIEVTEKVIGKINSKAVDQQLIEQTIKEVNVKK